MSTKPDPAQLAAIATAYTLLTRTTAPPATPARISRWRKAARLAILDQANAPALDTERRAR